MATVTPSNEWFLLAYDLPSRFNNALSADQKKWANDMSVKICYQLRFKHKCRPIQYSLWRVSESQLDAIDNAIREWLEEYRKNGLDAKIQVFPFHSSDEGYRILEDLEMNFLLEWLGSIQKIAEKMKERRKGSKTQASQLRRKASLIETALNEDLRHHTQYEECNDALMIVYDLLNDVDKICFRK